MTAEERAMEIYEKFGKTLGRPLLGEIVRHIQEAEQARSELPLEPYEDVLQEILKRSPAAVICTTHDAGDGRGLKYVVRSTGPQPMRLALSAYLDYRLAEDARRAEEMGINRNREGNYTWEA